MPPDGATARRKERKVKTDWAREKVEKYRYRVTIFQEPMATEDCIKLLRQERAAVKRMVKQLPGKLNPTIAVEDWGKGYIEACRDLLAALATRSTR